MFDDNFHICMIYGIEIKSINQSINLEERHNIQESHSCSRKVGIDATFFGKW
jgi:hypothetical protein